jgi:hypothetical protein
MSISDDAIDNFYNRYFGDSSNDSPPVDNSSKVLKKELDKINKKVCVLEKIIKDKKNDTIDLRKIVAYIKNVRKYLKKKDDRKLTAKVENLEKIVNSILENDSIIVGETNKKPDLLTKIIKVNFNIDNEFNYTLYHGKEVINIKNCDLIKNLVIDSLEGKISFNCDLFKNKEVIGSMQIINRETKHIYHGIIKTYKSDKLEYLLSNRPLVPLCAPMKCDVIFKINLYDE